MEQFTVAKCSKCSNKPSVFEQYLILIHLFKNIPSLSFYNMNDAPTPIGVIIIIPINNIIKSMIT